MDLENWKFKSQTVLLVNIKLSECQVKKNRKVIFILFYCYIQVSLLPHLIYFLLFLFTVIIFQSWFIQQWKLLHDDYHCITLITQRTESPSFIGFTRKAEEVKKVTMNIKGKIWSTLAKCFRFKIGKFEDLKDSNVCD